MRCIRHHLQGLTEDDIGGQALQEGAHLVVPKSKIGEGLKLRLVGGDLNAFVAFRAVRLRPATNADAEKEENRTLAAGQRLNDRGDMRPLNALPTP